MANGGSGPKVDGRRLVVSFVFEEVVVAVSDGKVDPQQRLERPVGSRNSKGSASIFDSVEVEEDVTEVSEDKSAPEHISARTASICLFELLFPTPKAQRAPLPGA